jgi:hypothetical protein
VDWSPPHAAMASKDFIHDWKLFREKALEVASQESVNKEEEVQSLLDRLTQLLFGLDESSKAKATGALELIVTMMKSLQVVVSDSIVLSALKAIKSCVIRNSIGRRRCRSAGIFEWLKDSDVSSADSANPVLVEEAMTALAAMCLSDDLNSLQGAMQFRTQVEEAATLFPKDEHVSLHQKISYLRALFDAMEREQGALLNEVNLWDDVTKAERTLKAGLEKQTAREWQDAVELYSEAIDLVEPYLSKTKLLDPLQWQLHFVRGTIRIKALSPSEAEPGLEDIDYCAQHPDEGSPMADVHALRSTALGNLGKLEDAKEALAKAIMMGLKHPAMEAWKQQLEVWESP